jgi:hypothetical protein
LPEGPPRAMVLPGAVNGDSNTKDRALWGRKTNELIGLIITGNLGGVWNSQTRPTADYVVNSAASEHPFFDVVYKGLAVSAFGGPLDASHPLGYRAGGPGYEIDAPGDGTPQGFVVLAASDLSRGWDDARWYPNRPRLAVMGMYQYPNGGTVFSVGSISWTLYMRWRTISTITKNVIQYFLK